MKTKLKDWIDSVRSKRLVLPPINEGAHAPAFHSRANNGNEDDDGGDGVSEEGVPSSSSGSSWVKGYESDNKTLLFGQ